MGLVIKDKNSVDTVALPMKTYFKDKEEKYLHHIAERNANLVSVDMEQQLYLFG